MSRLLTGHWRLGSAQLTVTYRLGLHAKRHTGHRVPSYTHSQHIIGDGVHQSKECQPSAASHPGPFCLIAASNVIAHRRVHCTKLVLSTDSKHLDMFVGGHYSLTYRSTCVKQRQLTSNVAVNQLRKTVITVAMVTPLAHLQLVRLTQQCETSGCNAVD